MTRLLCGIYGEGHPGSVAAYTDWMGVPPDLVSVHGGEDSLDSYTAVDFDMWVNGSSAPKCVSLPLLWAGVTLADAAAGRCDAGWTAAIAKMLGQESFLGTGGHPKTALFYVRIGWEQNGGWMKWNTQNNGQEGNFILAFQRIVTLLRSMDTEGRCRPVWCPSRGAEPPERTYPGDAYVSVVGIDTYWETKYGAPADPVAAFAFMRTDGWGFDWQVGFARAHGKGLAVCEWGVQLDTAAAFFKLAFAFFTANGYLYVNYWDSNAEYPGRLSPEVIGGVPQYPASAAAYRAEVRAIQLGQGAGASSQDAVVAVVGSTTGEPLGSSTGEPLGSIILTTGANGMTTITLSAALAAGTYTLAAVTPAAAAVPQPVLTKPMPLVLRLSEDAYLGDAQATIRLDGRVIAAAMPVTALRAKGQSQDVPLGDVDPTVSHVVVVSFIADAWGGSPDKDRNLYIDGYTLGGVATKIDTLLSVAGDHSVFISPAPA